LRDVRPHRVRLRRVDVGTRSLESKCREAEGLRTNPTRRALEKPIRTRRRWTRVGGAGALPRVGEGEVREDLPDHRGIVQRGNQAEAASTLGTRQHVDAERPVHQGRPAPGAQTARHAWARL
jgi:hypothetical protein